MSNTRDSEVMQLRLMDKVQVCPQVWVGDEKKRSQGKEQEPGCGMDLEELTKQSRMLSFIKTAYKFGL